MLCRCNQYVSIAPQNIIGRPLARIAQKIQRIEGGDFTVPLVIPGRPDDLAKVALALNSMCDRLTAMKQRLAAETAQRVETLLQLRHAERLTTEGDWRPASPMKSVPRLRWSSAAPK
jgi:nitrate/nitrite-specific signal transduction histidine kinase